MPVVSDFVVIQGDETKKIGDGATLWEKNFGTGGCKTDEYAFLMLMVKQLSHSTEPVNVKINNKVIGKIFPHLGADGEYWFTEIMNIEKGTLKDGSNELQIEAIGHPGSTAGNMYDDFYVRDVICFFKQEA